MFTLKPFVVAFVSLLSFFDIYSHWQDSEKIKQLEERAEYAETFISAHGWNIAQLRWEFDRQKRAKRMAAKPDNCGDHNLMVCGECAGAGVCDYLGIEGYEKCRECKGQGFVSTKQVED